MCIPVVDGVIDRRILANYRVAPDVLALQLPKPFRPQMFAGFGIAGICLIRLKEIRPHRFPRWLGFGSENAAHRIAVEWDEDGHTRCGVYIPRRDTSSRLNTLAGGRLFPGMHHLADFNVRESGEQLYIEMHSRDNSARVLVNARVAENLPDDSVFPTLAAASQFFEVGSLGYSPHVEDGKFDGLELKSIGWRVEPLAVKRVESSFFENVGVFPPGSVEFDSALLMRGIQHQWLGRETLCCPNSCS